MHGDHADARLQADLNELKGAGEHEGSPEHRMAGKWELPPRREDAQPGVSSGLGRVAEDRLREVDLARERLEQLLVDSPRVGENRDLVARQRHVCEHVADDVAEGAHAATLLATVASTTRTTRRSTRARAGSACPGPPCRRSRSRR